MREKEMEGRGRERDDGGRDWKRRVGGGEGGKRGGRRRWREGRRGRKMKRDRVGGGGGEGVWRGGVIQKGKWETQRMREER